MAGRVIVITSGKGGVGKTTTSANIGTALAKNGHSVVLIDTDIGLRNLDLLLGLENRIVYTLVDVVEELLDAEHVAMVGDGHASHTVGYGFVYQTGNACLPVKDRIVGVDV